MNILDAIDDRNLFRSAIRDPSTWTAWRTFLGVLFGLPVGDEHQELVATCTGVTDREPRAYNEAWLVCGRRAGKSFVLALIAVYLACFRDYRQHLTIGERATVMVVAADRRQARTILRYVRGLLELPMLKPLVERETAEGFDLKNRITIEIITCSIRSVRGYTIAACLCDEVAFWRSEDSVSPDRDVLDAIRPGMATIPGAMLLCASSPYARRGALWDAHRRHFGKPDAPVLVWQAATRVMNPTVPQSLIDQAMEADPASASAEYLATFRSDVATYLSAELVAAAVDTGVVVRPPVSGVLYRSGCDPSGGVGDSFTLSIVHDEDEVAVVDCVVEIKAPFNPTTATDQMAATLKSYGLRETVGDRYAASWVVDAFQKVGISYRHSDRDRSAIYLDALPLFSSGRVSLLDNQRLITQFASLERKTGPSGKDRVDHSPGAHDDLCNATALAMISTGNGEADVPVAEIGTYVSRIYGDGRSSVADRIDRLSPQAALARGIITPARASQLGFKPC